MKNTYLILLTTKVYFLILECALSPDINLEGRLIANNDSKILQLSCTTNIAVHLCTIEFLIDKRTHDNIRYHDNNCYHTMSICSPKVCKCSGDCMSFTLNVTVTNDMRNYLYSCASKIENKGVIYSANISVIQDSNGGSTIIQKIVNTSNSVSPAQQATTISPEIDTNASFSAPSIIVGAASGFLFLVILFCVIPIICRIYRQRKSGLETVVYSGGQGTGIHRSTHGLEPVAYLEGQDTGIPPSTHGLETVAYSEGQVKGIPPSTHDTISTSSRSSESSDKSVLLEY